MPKKKRKPLPRIGGKAVTLTPGPTPSSLRTSTTAQVNLGDFHDRLTPKVEIDTSKPLTKHATLQGNGLPYDVSEQIIKAANTLGVDPAKVPNIPPDEVNRLIHEHPEIALEGLARLGKVMVVPQVATEGHFDPIDIKARVIGDLRRGFFDNVAKDRGEYGAMYTDFTIEHVREATVIDITAVYDRWMAAGKGNDLYELKMAPPWNNALLTYHNITGNVWVMHMVASDIRQDPMWTPANLEEIKWESQPPADHVIDWERVRWVCSVQVYCGGMGQMQDESSPPTWVKTVGPLMVWRVAVYEDGSPADVHWTQLVSEVPHHKFNNALGVLCETLNMCNCVNVTVAHSSRPMPRAQRRRMERLGVRFSEIHVKPTSKSYRGKSVALADMEMPLHGVRGHYANYGVDGRGLLFGKLAGRYWIPPHMRGTGEVGTTEQAYTIE